MVLGTIRSSTAFSCEFSLHANGPRDNSVEHFSSEFSLHANRHRKNSVEHFILIRVLLTRRWPQGQFGRVASFHLSYPYTRRGKKQRKREKNHFRRTQAKPSITICDSKSDKFTFPRAAAFRSGMPV